MNSLATLHPCTSCMQQLTRIPVMLTLFALTTWTSAQELVWARAVGAQGDDVAQSLAVDLDGNVIVAGYFEGTVDLDPGMGQEFHTSSGANDIFVQKLDSAGALVWGWGLGGTDADYPTGLSTDADANIYVCGTFNGIVDFDPAAGVTELASTGGYDIFFAKYDAEGAFVWARGCGSAGYDEPKSVAVGPLGSVYLLSYFSATIDADPGAALLPIMSAGALDILVQRFDADGGLLWANSIGSAGTDLGLSMALDADENIWFTGSFENTLDMDPGIAAFPLTSAGAWDIFVAKWSAGGAFLWAGRTGGVENFDTGYDIAVDADGNAVVVGSFFGTGDFDPGAGEFPLTASSLGSDEIFVQKLDANGAFLWAVSMGGTDADLAYGVALEADGRIDVTGFFSGTADFDPHPFEVFEMTTASPANFFDSYLVELSANGDMISAWQFGGANSISTQSIARGSDDAVFIAGQFENTPDFDPATGQVILGSAGFRDAFIIRLEALPTGISVHHSAGKPALYPNPALDHVWLEVDVDLVGSPYVVCDQLGRVVAQGRLEAQRTSLSVDGFATGMYHVDLLHGAVGATFTVVRSQ